MSYNNELSAADVAAVTHNNGGGWGFGGDGGWLAILFILAAKHIGWVIALHTSFGDRCCICGYEWYI